MNCNLRQQPFELAAQPAHGVGVDLVFALVVGEVQAHVLDVELGLLAGVEALDQLFQPRLQRHDDDFVEHGAPPRECQPSSQDAASIRRLSSSLRLAAEL